MVKPIYKCNLFKSDAISKWESVLLRSSYSRIFNDLDSFKSITFLLPLCRRHVKRQTYRQRERENENKLSRVEIIENPYVKFIEINNFSERSMLNEMCVCVCFNRFT